MIHFLLVALGGAIGASLRHLAGLAALRFLGPGFPWATMAVNVSGSLAMGVFVGWLAGRVGEGGSSHALRLFVATGVLGGFTTFSAFSLDFAALWRDGDHANAILYALFSVILSLGGLFAGMSLAKMATAS